jgi:transcriptional regulator with XRE-family HTH domain
MGTTTAHTAPTGIVPDVLFRHRLRIALELADLDPGQLADELLASRSTVYNWLKGPGRPSRRKMERIAAITGVDSAWLVGDPHEGRSNQLAEREDRSSRCTAQARRAA